MAESSLIKLRVGVIAHSLIDEDYRIMVNVPLPGSYFIKLRHRYNGNHISVVGNYQRSDIRLYKNGKLIKIEPV